MKTTLFNRITILLSLLLLITPIVQGQVMDTSVNKTQQEQYDMFMQKHKSKTTAGWITLGSGLAMFGAGLAISSGKEYEVGENGVEQVLVLVGPAVALASIPFFVSAGRNKRKAKLALKRESTVVGFKNNTEHLSLSFTMPF